MNQSVIFQYLMICIFSVFICLSAELVTNYDKLFRTPTCTSGGSDKHFSDIQGLVVGLIHDEILLPYLEFCKDNKSTQHVMFVRMDRQYVVSLGQSSGTVI